MEDSLFGSPTNNLTEEFFIKRGKKKSEYIAPQLFQSVDIKNSNMNPKIKSSGTDRFENNFKPKINSKR